MGGGGVGGGLSGGSGGNRTSTMNRAKSVRNVHADLHTEEGSGELNNQGIQMTNNAGELFAWGPLWDVGNMTSYPAKSDKISRDFADITSVAAITHGADWLTSQLCR